MSAGDETNGSENFAGDILVVDDNPHNLIAIEAALGDFSLSLVTVASGAAALRALLRQDFALILLDIQMPGMDGFETAKLIRSRRRSQHTPVIFVTAYDHAPEQILRGYELGAVDFLFKPIVPEVLRAKVSVFVELRRHAAEIRRQEALLREHERREHEEHLKHERQRWEALAMQREMEAQRRAAEENAKRAEELARIVSEREAAQTELTRINRELQEADRRKNEFLAVLAHELRTPLSPLVMGVELLRTSAAAPDKAASVLEAMDRQARHLTRLVDDLLEVSRISRGTIDLQRQTVSLEDAVREAMRMCAPEFERRRQSLQFSSDGASPTVDGDPVRLTQVVTNLLTNASRYSDDGGVVRVRVSLDGESAAVSVQDNGRGIGAETLPYIFNLFARGERSEGLGIGLSLVRQLVELHGGSIEATSDGLSHGSTFCVRLPTLQHEWSGSSDSIHERSGLLGRTIEPAVSQSPLTAVVVEDQQDIGMLFQHMLEARGHRVILVEDGTTGVATVLEQQPDVAFVDIGLPDMGGAEVASRIRADLGKNVRLVAVTGFGDPLTRQRALDAGFDAYIVKPLRGADLDRELALTSALMDRCSGSKAALRGAAPHA